MRGRKIYRNKKVTCFVQVDKNNQVCELYDYNPKLGYDERIGAPIERQILSDFRGQPLVLAWDNLIEALQLEEEEGGSNE
jgi:hypothetical protein